MTFKFYPLKNLYYHLLLNTSKSSFQILLALTLVSSVVEVKASSIWPEILQGEL